MTDQDLLKAFKRRAKRIAEDRKDIRFLRTMAFLKANELLDTNLPIQGRPRITIEAGLALQVIYKFVVNVTRCNH